MLKSQVTYVTNDAGMKNLSRFKMHVRHVSPHDLLHLKALEPAEQKVHTVHTVEKNVLLLVDMTGLIHCFNQV